MGIEFTKRDVKPTQSIRDQLDDLAGASLRSIRNQLKRKSVKTESETVDHSSSERLIDSKAGLLIKPAPRNESTSTDSETNGADESSATPLGTVKFRVGYFGREGSIYACEQKGRTTFVDWNADHPFYERFILANKDDKDAMNAVDALVFSMAAAELKVFDEDNRNFVESWKAIFSVNLHTLLS